MARRSWLGKLQAAVLVLLLLPPAAFAEEDYGAFLEGLWPEAEALGISKETFEGALRKLKLDLSLPEIGVKPGEPDRNTSGQPEFVKPPGAYIKASHIQSMAATAAKLAQRWGTDLDAIEAEYGVSRNVLLAIWGRETAFGTYELPHNAIRVLASQAFRGLRKEYFRTELLWALKILHEGHASAAEMRSSWAGAMGHTQLMPTNWRDYAVDLDGDGRRNIWSSVPDALASAAKSLASPQEVEGKPYQWLKGRSWGYEVRKHAAFDCTMEGLDGWKPLSEWAALGFERAYGRKFSDEQLADEAYLLAPQGAHGPVFLVTANFLILKTYNFADLYALFVGHLADRIGGGKPFEAPWGKAQPVTERQALELQTYLVGLGLDVGKVDGKVGWRTRVALGIFEKANGLEVDCYPTPDDVEAMGRGARL
jgi:lytic murein transglycosylase